MRQGNNNGTQYRSTIYCADAGQLDVAETSRKLFQQRLTGRGFGTVTTEIRHPEPHFYYAEDEHQQYLAKNRAAIADCMEPV